jgi:ABC-type branched-subunit amino acid transport system substrate-binding protein
MTLVRIALAALALTILSCSTAPKKVPPKVAPNQAKKELAKIQIDVAAGSTRRAVSRLRHLIAKNPKSDVADDATIQLANLYFKAGQFEAAYHAYMSLVESDVFSVNEAEAVLGASRSLHKMGRMDEALALSTRGLKIPGLSESQRLEFYRVRYALQITLGDRLDALQALAYIYDKDPRADVKGNAQARAHEIVSSFLTEGDLEKVVSDPTYGFVRPQAAFRLALFRLKEKDFDGAREQFSHAAEWGHGSPVQVQAENYISQIDSRRHVDAYSIGAVLPLSGKYSYIAQRTLHGLQLGLGIYGSRRSDFKLAVLDSEGTPEGGRKAVERLVTENNVIAVVGSLLSRTAASVAAKSEELGVPSVALSQKAGLTRAGSYIFRNAVTSEMQVKELVHLAMDELGLKRFAILYPNEPYGTEYANLFWDEVLARGGTVAGAQVYSPEETDFRGPIKRLVGTYYVDDRRDEFQSRLTDWFKAQKRLSARQMPPDDLLPPIIDFDAIFIPDGAKAVGQIAPMLAYQGVQNVRLLGTNVWNTSELLRRGQKNVDRAVFVDTNLVNDPKFKNSTFYAQYKKVFNEEPGLFEVQGYEVGQMLRQLIVDKSNHTRPDLAEALTDLQQFQGVSGPMTMNDQHELQRPLTPFIVKDEQILAWTPEIESETSAAKPDEKKPVRK